jgi:hypothetical protein
MAGFTITIQEKVDRYTNPGETYTGTWLGRYFVKMMDRIPDKEDEAFKPSSAPNLDAHEVVSAFIGSRIYSNSSVSVGRDLNRSRSPSLTKYIKMNLVIR